MSSETAATKSYQHENTLLTSSKHPISLRPLQIEDVPRFIAILADDPSSKPLTTEQATGAITRMQESARTPTIITSSSSSSSSPSNNIIISGPGRVNLAVIHNPTNTLIGLSGYGAIHTLERGGSSSSSEDPKLRAGDAGVVIDPEYRGKGFAVECMKMSMDWGVRAVEDGGLGLDLVTVTTGEENGGMRRLVDERLGLKGRGVVREGGPSGKEVYYELKAEDWREVSKDLV